jgi:hypothetical protein
MTNTRKEFLALLEKTKEYSLKELKSLGLQANKIQSSDMEELVLSSLKKAAIGTNFDGKITRGTLHAFPDMSVGNKFGVEVKMTIGDKWTSFGNSILESTRAASVEEIFIFFVKIGGDIDIKYRAYSECLNEIAVTHSPRYMIDMELPSGQSIFDKIGIKYNDLRSKPNPIRYIKDYYRKQLSEGEELWWIDQDSSSTPIIKGFGNLSDAEQKRFKIESMILFPEIFGNSMKKYSRPAAYLFTEYSALSSNMRDNFTAGGTVKLKIKGHTITTPKMLFNLLLRSKEINKALKEMNKNKLLHYWRVDVISEPVINQWKALLDKSSSWGKGKIKASDLFEFGLHAK